MRIRLEQSKRLGRGPLGNLQSRWPSPQQVSVGLLLLGSLRLSPVAAVGVNYLSGNALGVPVHLIQVDLRLPNVRVSPAVCPHFPRGREDFKSFLARTQPRAAITGAPVDVHLGRPPVDIVIGGQVVNRGQRGTIALFGREGQMQLQRSVPGERWVGGPDQSGLGGGPKLLSQGAIDIQADKEGFTKPSDVAEALHTALGLTHEGMLLLVHVREAVDLFQLAAIMKRLGCVEAMNLWSGETCGLAYNGSIISDPKGPITHALVVYDDPQAYAAAQPQFLPGLSPAVQSGPTFGSDLRESVAPPASTGREALRPIRIIQPAEGTLVTETVLIRALAQPRPARTYIGFYVDGEFRSASNVSPYEFRFNPRQFQEGEHTIEARLYNQNWEFIAQDRITLKVGRPPQEASDAGN